MSFGDAEIIFNDEGFIKVTGVADFDSEDYGLLREYTNTFKRYLERMKAAGTPVLEDDGSEMSVKMVF
ncbi:MAG: hypothetical protein J6R62_03925 [Rikenellaceae bacterium]|nr:hypothetical protein [Rikenellaceae bacterium]